MKFLPVSVQLTSVIIICALCKFDVAAQNYVTKYGRSDSPPYQDIGTFYQGYPDFTYEERVYDSAVWITTQSRSGFNILFQYISGRNSEQKKIAMTSPVLTTISSSAPEMAFYLPPNYQNNPPYPTSWWAKLKKFPSRTVYVRRYSGWARYESVQSELSKLKRIVTFDKKKFDSSMYATAGYDGPMHRGPRRNEVWLFAEDK